jgi:hypothetical protein
MASVLVLRSCAADMTSYHGQFKWPESGPISCSDWKPTQACGSGLHGWLWGEGDASLGDFSEGAKWLVVSVDEAMLIDLSGKVKFPSGDVVFCGDRMAAGKYVVDNGGFGKRVISGTATAGDSGTATAGVRGTATAGDSGTATGGVRGTATAGDSGTATAGVRGTATAGDSGTATAGDSGTATAGVRGTATAGHRGTATAGDSGTATAGVRGTATAGYGGTATAGYGGTATAGDSGTATAGHRGTATAGDSGTATAGYGGNLVILQWNGKRYKTRFASVQDEDGDGQLKPNVKYRLNNNGEFVEVA